MRFFLKPFSSFRRPPDLGFDPAGKESLAVWANWEPKREPASFYRIRVTLRTPEEINKERRISLTFDPPRTEPFASLLQLPADFRDALLTSARGIVSLELLSTDHRTVVKDLSSRKVRAIYLGEAGPARWRGGLTGSHRVDEPVVASLDFDELNARKKKLELLEEKARARTAPKVVPAVPPPTPTQVTVGPN